MGIAKITALGAVRCFAAGSRHHRPQRAHMAVFSGFSRETMADTVSRAPPIRL